MLLQLPTQWTKRSAFVEQLGESWDEEAKERFFAALQRVSQRYYPKLKYYPSQTVLFSRPAENEEEEVEYILKDVLVDSSKQKQCYNCGGVLRDWALIGGGYQTNDSWYAALLREALPVVVCEPCYRCNWLEQCSDDVVETGIAVLPELESPVTITRRLEIQRYMIQLHKRVARLPYFELDNFLLQQEIAEAGLRPSIHVRAHTGQVKVMYSFGSLANQALQFDLCAARSFERSFEIDTKVRVQQQHLKHGLDVYRTVGDFYWLRDQLMRGKQRFIYPLPATQTLHEYCDPFLQVKLTSLSRFLTACCQDVELRKHKSLEAFFRPGFLLARSMIACRDEDESKLEFVKPSRLALHQTNNKDKSTDFLLRSLQQVETEEGKLQALSLQFALQHCPTTTLSATPTCEVDVSKQESLVHFVQVCAERAAQRAHFWQDLEDYLSV